MKTNYVFSQASYRAMKHVHPAIIAVMTLALKRSPYDFRVTEGIRTIDRQKELVRDGKSQTMNSMHLPQQDGLAYALDIVLFDNGEVTWDFDKYHEVSKVVMQCADELGVEVTWGGDWDRDGDVNDHTFHDGPHYQLNPKQHS